MKPKKWSLGILNHKRTDEVPGTSFMEAKVVERIIYERPCFAMQFF
jgi:hypothetical protein